ncbi:MAG: uroporphyrinogen-III C-methyltransferase [Crenarchaeota archaeon]|nr:uroporphyrinogen-III C-methyltransferase [Thermoproteota archaeon]
MENRVYIVGAGPGDPELITVKGLKALARADVVLYDRLAPRELLKYSRRAEHIYVGKSPGRHSLSQEEIISLMVQYYERGLNVVRLHGGDPFLYGRGFEEVVELRRRGVKYEVIPGISSIYAVPERYEIPLVLRGVASSIGIATGTEDPKKGRRFVDFKKLARAVDTIVIVMGSRNLQNIARELLDAGLDPNTPLAILRAYIQPETKIITTLQEVATQDLNVESPVVIVIGRVVSTSSVI